MDLKKDRPGFRPIRHGRADGCNEGLLRSLRVNGGLDAIRHDRNGSELASGDEKVRKETGIPGI